VPVRSRNSDAPRHDVYDVVDARVRARLTLGVTLPANARIRTVQLNGADVRPVVRLTHRGREVLVPGATGTAQRLRGPNRLTTAEHWSLRPPEAVA
jgi:hypothetical protein